MKTVVPGTEACFECVDADVFVMSRLMHCFASPYSRVCGIQRLQPMTASKPKQGWVRVDSDINEPGSLSSSCQGPWTLERSTPSADPGRRTRQSVTNMSHSFKTRYMPWKVSPQMPKR